MAIDMRHVEGFLNAFLDCILDEYVTLCTVYNDCMHKQITKTCGALDNSLFL